MKDSIKKFAKTHLLAILGFIAITVALYYPYFVDGLQISQHDVLQGNGATHLLEEYEANGGEEALWLYTMFSGMPAYLNGMEFSINSMHVVYKIFKLGMPHPEGITFISFISFYVLLLSFGTRPWIAFAGAVAFGLNGFSIIGIMAGHNAKIASVALMPLVLAGIHLTFNHKKWIGAGLTAIGLGLQLYTNHYQITYYLLLITLIYGAFALFFAIKNGLLKPFANSLLWLVGAAILAVGSNSGDLLTISEYSKYSIRGKSELTAESAESGGLDKEYAFRYSNGIMEPLFLFVPNFFGGSTQQELSENSESAQALLKAGMSRAQVNQQIKALPTYWGDQPATAPYYAGSIAFCLAIAAMFFLKKEEKWWLIVAGSLGIILSWGHNLESVNIFLFDYLPGYNKFRAVTFTIIITLIALYILAFTGLERIFSSEYNKPFFQKLLKAFGVGVGFLVLLIISSWFLGFKAPIDAQLPDWLVDPLRTDRASLLRSDAFRALFFVIAFSGCTIALFKSKLKATLAVALLIGLITLDNFTLSKRFIKSEMFEKAPAKSYFVASEADQAILDVSKPGERVFNLQNPFNEARTSYYHESIGGYHGAKLRRYQDIISHNLNNELSGIISSLQAGKRDFSNFPVTNMLNARYFMAGNSKNAVLRNPNALGTGWIVGRTIAVNSADDEIAQLNNFDPSKEAIIDQTKFNLPSINTKVNGSVQLISKTPNELIYSANLTGGDGLAIFSEVYYPKGWHAFVDGEEIDILRANYILRAVPLKAGNHEVKFLFEPTSYSLGNQLTTIFGVLTVLVFITGVYMEAKQEIIPKSE